MPKKYFFQTILYTFITNVFVIFFSQLFFACASNAEIIVSSSSNETVPVEKKHRAPSLIVRSHQEAVYNGKPQPIFYFYSGDDIPEIIYYPSLRALMEGHGGRYSAPSQAGSYNVLVRCLHEEAYVEYRIFKNKVRIKAAAIQEAIYNGSPKRVQAEAEPPVPLSFSYYPNREMREAAIKAENDPAFRNTAQTLPDIYRGYRRVEAAPTEQGTYYVWIFFPGDENHEAAHANVEFTILPVPAALPRFR